MSDFDYYVKWGFEQNPFLVRSLQPDAQGKRLLVGRDEEVAVLCRRLHKEGKITCLDGHVGVGKTSVVNIAARKCLDAYLARETTQLLIPCRTSFQLRKDEDTEEFCARVFVEVAQTLLEARGEIKQIGFDMDRAEQLNTWLNAPIATTINVGISAYLTAGTAKTLNGTSGFSSSGLERMITEWLGLIYKSRNSGGVICIIDNLELLETAVTARRTLEALRDRLFAVHGLRWVFCGADGVIHSLAASPRISAFLSTPVDIENISASCVQPLLHARIQEFCREPERAYLPITNDDFRRLYVLINRNLRDLLGMADEYCENVADLGVTPQSDEQKSVRFNKWLDKATVQRYVDLKSRISNSAWGILDTAMSDQFKGSFGVGNFGAFKTASRETLSNSTYRRYLNELTKHKLLSRSIEDEESDDVGRRDVYTVTGTGALVHYGRWIRDENSTLAPTNWLRAVHYDKNATRR